MLFTGSERTRLKSRSPEAADLGFTVHGTQPSSPCLFLLDSDCFPPGAVWIRPGRAAQDRQRRPGTSPASLLCPSLQPTALTAHLPTRRPKQHPCRGRMHMFSRPEPGFSPITSGETEALMERDPSQITSQGALRPRPSVDPAGYLANPGSSLEPGCSPLASPSAMTTHPRRLPAQSSGSLPPGISAGLSAPADTRLFPSILRGISDPLRGAQTSRDGLYSF